MATTSFRPTFMNDFSPHLHALTPAHRAAPRTSTTCIICMLPTSLASTIYPCRHRTFCQPCVTTWVNTFRTQPTPPTCPLCRHVVLHYSHSRTTVGSASSGLHKLLGEIGSWKIYDAFVDLGLEFLVKAWTEEEEVKVVCWLKRIMIRVLKWKYREGCEEEEERSEEQDVAVEMEIVEMVKQFGAFLGRYC